MDMFHVVIPGFRINCRPVINIRPDSRRREERSPDMTNARLARGSRRGIISKSVSDEGKQGGVRVSTASSRAPFVELQRLRFPLAASRRMPKLPGDRDTRASSTSPARRFHACLTFDRESGLS